MKAWLRLCCVGYIAAACLITVETRQVLRCCAYTLHRLCDLDGASLHTLSPASQITQELHHSPATTRTTDLGDGAHDGSRLHMYSRKLHEPAASSAAADARTSNSPLKSASCNVLITGHASEPGVHVVLGDKVTSDQGVTHASITCTTDPPGLLVPLGVNETWITPQMVAGFRVCENLWSTCFDFKS